MPIKKDSFASAMGLSICAFASQRDGLRLAAAVSLQSGSCAGGSWVFWPAPNSSSVPAAIITSASLIIREIVEPGLGQDQVPLAIKKLDVEPFFERDDAVTDGSRRYVQFLGGELEAAATRRGLKQAQAIERWYKPHRRGDRNSPFLFLGSVAARMKVCIAAKMKEHDSKSVRPVTLDGLERCCQLLFSQCAR
jgi:hypothetical protein